MITVGVVDSVDGLASLRDAWIDLFDRCPVSTPFQRPEWLIPWCRHFAPAAPVVLVARADERLVGLLPLAGEGRSARLLGEGISDYLDALVDPAHAPAVLAAFADRLAAWDLCDFAALPPWSPLLQLPAPVGFLDAVTPDDVCPVIAPAGALPREMVRNLRRARARAESMGPVAFAVANRATRLEMLESLFALHEARWAGAGVLGDATVRAFHREASAAFQEAGLLRLAALTLGARVAAVVYAFAAHDVRYLYLQGYDPAFEEASPGTLAVGFAVAEAAREGARAVDLLRGREAYKYRFGARDQATFRRTIRRG